MSRGGTSIAVEVWAVRSAEFASLVEGIPAPLGIGKIELHDGERVPGFVCETYATEAAVDITELGGWRAYLETLSG
jgi:allophanate hydrolase